MVVVEIDEATSLTFGAICASIIVLYHVCVFAWNAMASRKSTVRHHLWVNRSAAWRTQWATVCVANSGVVGLFASPSSSFVLRNAIYAASFFGKAAAGITFVFVSVAVGGFLPATTRDTGLYVWQLASLGFALFGSYLSFAVSVRMLTACSFIATTPPLSDLHEARLARARVAGGVAKAEAKPTAKAACESGIVPDSVAVLRPGNEPIKDSPTSPGSGSVEVACSENAEHERMLLEARRLGTLIRMLRRASLHWVIGIRLFYLGIIFAFWMVSPWALVLATCVTLVVQIYSDFFAR